MSANMRLTGISAPKTPSLLRLLMHDPQMSGLPGKRANPTWRSTAPRGPSNGAAQSLQLGPCGMCRITRRIRARPGSSPERTPRIASSGVGGRGIAPTSYAWRSTGLLAREARFGSERLGSSPAGPDGEAATESLGCLPDEGVARWCQDRRDSVAAIVGPLQDARRHWIVLVAVRQEAGYPGGPEVRARTVVPRIRPREVARAVGERHW